MDEYEYQDPEPLEITVAQAQRMARWLKVANLARYVPDWVYWEDFKKWFRN